MQKPLRPPVRGGQYSRVDVAADWKSKEAREASEKRAAEIAAQAAERVGEALLWEPRDGRKPTP